MSTARTVLTVAAAVVVLPMAMRARESGLEVPRAATPISENQATAADLRAYLDAIRGSNAIQCEIVLSSFNSWSSSRAPDRDTTAWKLSMVVHRRVDEPLVPELVAAMRSPDDCVSRVAARVLGRSKLPAARSALLAALGDENVQLRRLAAIGIGFSDDSTANRSLVRALGDRDERVRAAAAWALGAVN
ncbi:MAG TPA: HEAT repeat domain-containing protein [Gemmatimonadaceae bacterium]